MGGDGQFSHKPSEFPGHSQILSRSCGENREKVWYHYTSRTGNGGLG